MRHALRCLVVCIALAGCAPRPPDQAATVAPAGFPASLRWDLVPKWIEWSNLHATVSWPPNGGCAAAPGARTLAAGDLIDRFGDANGTFFSPKGESFHARAVPYVCRQMDYRVFKVTKPLPVTACKAAPWFDEPGGAVQLQTAEPAGKLVADGRMTVVTYVVGGSSGSSPQCGDP